MCYVLRTANPRPAVVPSQAMMPWSRLASTAREESERLGLAMTTVPRSQAVFLIVFSRNYSNFGPFSAILTVVLPIFWSFKTYRMNSSSLTEFKNLSRKLAALHAPFGVSSGLLTLSFYESGCNRLFTRRIYLVWALFTEFPNEAFMYDMVSPRAVFLRFLIKSLGTYDTVTGRRLGLGISFVPIS